MWRQLISAWLWRWYQRGIWFAAGPEDYCERNINAARVRIHLRTTSAVMYHLLCDTNSSDSFLVYQCILRIYCIHCIHLCKNINVCSRAHFILYLFIHFIYTGVRGKSDLCKIKIQHIALEFRQDMEFLIILRWCILKSARMKILHCCRKR